MRYHKIGLFAALVFFSGCASTIQNGAMIRAYSAMKGERYDAALTWLSTTETHGVVTPDLQAEIAFLRGRSYEGLQRMPEAIGAYRYVVATFPESTFAFQAREWLKEFEARRSEQTPEAASTVVMPAAGQPPQQR